MKLRQGLLVLICSGALAASAGTPVFVKLRNTVVLERLDIHLSDVAEITARDSQMVASLGRVNVAHLGSLLMPHTLDQAQLSETLIPAAEKLGVELVWGATQSVTVTGRLRSVSLMAAVDQGAAHLMKLGGKNPAVSLEVIHPLDMVDVPPGVTEVKPVLNEIRRLGKIIELPVQISVDGVIVARPVIHYLVKGEAGRRALEINGNASITSSLDEQGTSRNADVSVPASGVVTRNRTVRLVIQSGPIQLEGEGIALANAGLGEIVKVRRPATGAELRGRVVDAGTVMVEEP